MQKYCDIIPDATGWVYVIDGVQSASFYHTCELAKAAAEIQLGKTPLTQHGIFRQQGVNGEMYLLHHPRPGVPQGALNG